MLHALITAIVIAFAEYAFGVGVMAGWIVSAFYIGREHAQAEYRAIEHYYGGLRGNGPWWIGFQRRAWTGKGLFDWLGPLFVVVAYGRF